MTLRVFQLHRSGKGRIPDGFDDVYLCELLHLSYTELMDQPADWVDNMRLWHEQKARAGEVRQKEMARRAKRIRAR